MFYSINVEWCLNNRYESIRAAEIAAGRELDPNAAANKPEIQSVRCTLWRYNHRPYHIIPPVSHYTEQTSDSLHDHGSRVPCAALHYPYPKALRNPMYSNDDNDQYIYIYKVYVIIKSSCSIIAIQNTPQRQSMYELDYYVITLVCVALLHYCIIVVSLFYHCNTIHYTIHCKLSSW